MRPSRLAYSLLFFLLSFSLWGQNSERTDSLVRLLGCDELQQVEEFGFNFRKANGHARFEHNSTLLVCDTAIWNVNSNVIKAFGDVRIIQNETVLTSDRLEYDINENLAKFRGSLVQLQDKDRNTLRTNDLDYNTKDSVAVFRNGGSMRDKDGQVIESDMGTYDSKIKTFSFSGSVNMYTDSIFVKTAKLEYGTNTNMAIFGRNTRAWRDSYMLSANAGWYDRNQEIFLFRNDVHLLTSKQEAWSDSLKYYKIPNNAEMFGNVELLDTTRNVTAVAGYMQYLDSLSLIMMTRKPAVIVISEENGQKDTVHICADTLIYNQLRMCDIPKAELGMSEKRLDAINGDAVTAYRQNAAAAAKEAAEKAKKALEEENNFSNAKSMDRNAPYNGSNDEAIGLPAPFDPFPALEPPKYVFQIPDSASISRVDSSLTNPLDSTVMAVADSTVKEIQLPDTTKMGFLKAVNSVKVFRKDMQVVCDFLAYNDLDSLVRLYSNPIVWNETNRQYSADSIFVAVRNQAIEKASLMSNAFIAVQEDSICFDQIKGTEMMAYFDSTGALKRFDAMGGSSGLFYIEENEALATVNKFEAKMMTVTFIEGQINDIYYFDNAKSDAYPVVQLTVEEKSLKGFDWQPEKRPKGPEDVTTVQPRMSERSRYEREEQPKFVHTDQYFPGYMKSVHQMLESQDSLRQARKLERERQDALLASEGPSKEAVDSLKGQLLVVPDGNVGGTGGDEEGGTTDGAEGGTTDGDEEDIPDGIEDLEDGIAAEEEPSDMRKEAKDSSLSRLSLPAMKTSERDSQKNKLKEEKLAARDERLKLKRREKESKWAELDAKDAEKAAKKAAKALEKKRKKTLEALKARDEREAHEKKAFERYVAKYERRKARQEASKAKRGLSGGASEGVFEKIKEPIEIWKEGQE